MNTARSIKEQAGSGNLPRGFLCISRVQAYTLVEFLGVLAVLTIAASMLVPKVFKSLDRAAWTKEVNDLTAISNGFVLQILRSNAIPSETSWAVAVANWTTRPSSQILTNDRRYARLFFYDQGGWLNGRLPYVQSTAGTTSSIPSSARIAIVSTIAKALPFANGSLSASNFNSIWNSTQGTIPSYLTGWNGNGYDLVIQRIPIDSLFHHLILTTRDTSAAAGYSINSATYAAVPNGAGGTNTYYLDGTTVGLWINGTLANRFILTRDMSVTFEAGSWGEQLTGSGTDDSGTAQDFAFQAARFVSMPTSPGPGHGADTQGVLSAFYNFMYAYALWANKCPHFVYTGNNGTADADYLILKNLGQTGSGGIIDGATGPGGGGLLQ